MTINRIIGPGAAVLAASAVASLLCLSSPAGAAPAAEAAAPTAAQSPADKRAEDRDEWHIKELHEKLKITAAQEPLWATVADVMRSNDAKIDALGKERHDRAAGMSALDDLRSFAAITEAHAAGTRNFIPAFEALYKAMPADQQANADRVFRTVGTKSHKKGH